jgi:hypothetical protein
MSYDNFKRALELAKQCDGYLDGGGKPQHIIDQAETLLNIRFSTQTHEYFRYLGFLEFFGHEFYGIVKDDFSGTHAGCAIEATLQDRKELDLPIKWLTLYFFDDGYYGYLDYSQLNEDGEPPVIMAVYNGKEYINIEKVAEDFGDFLLKSVQEQLKNQ